MDGPRIVVTPPGPKSLKIWEEEKKYITPGLSVDMKVMKRGPVVFERGKVASYGMSMGTVILILPPAY